SGPILLPRFGERGKQPWYDGHNRTFFFFSYEGLRLRQPQSAIVLVPSLAARQASVPTIRPFLDAYPVPNGTTFSNGFAQFAASFSNPATLDATSIRVDHEFTDNLNFFVRFNDSPSNSRLRGDGARTLNTISGTTLNSKTLTVGITQTLSSDLIN